MINLILLDNSDTLFNLAVVVIFFALCTGIGIVIGALVWIYNYFSKKEQLQIEGEIIEVEDKPYKSLLPSSFYNNNSNLPFSSSPTILTTIHEYWLRIKVPNQKELLEIQLPLPLFKKLSTLVGKRIRLYCDKLLWSNEITIQDYRLA